MLVKTKCGCIGVDLQNGSFLVLWNCEEPGIKVDVFDKAFRTEQPGEPYNVGESVPITEADEKMVCEALKRVSGMAYKAEKVQKHLKRLLDL